MRARGARQLDNPNGAPAPARRLLVVEDDALQAESLAFILRQEGYAVDVVATGADALAAVRDQPTPDAVLLDVALPDLSGIEVTRRLRVGSDVPIIMLTARRHESDKIAGLDAGANDYVTKPFNPGELLARIRALLRASARRDPGGGAPDGVYAIGALRLDIGIRRLTRDGRPITVSARQFDILQLLAEAAGRVVPRQHLLATFWGADFYGDERALDVYVRAIRKKIEPDPDKPVYLHTVRRVGYCLAEDRPRDRGGWYIATAPPRRPQLPHGEK